MKTTGHGCQGKKQRRCYKGKEALRKEVWTNLNSTSSSQSPPDVVPIEVSDTILSVWPWNPRFILGSLLPHSLLIIRNQTLMIPFLSYLLDVIPPLPSHGLGWQPIISSCLKPPSTKAILYTARKTSLKEPSDCDALFKVLQTFFFALSITQKDFRNLVPTCLSLVPTCLSGTITPNKETLFWISPVPPNSLDAWKHDFTQSCSIVLGEILPPSLLWGSSHTDVPRSSPHLPTCSSISISVSITK